MQTRRETKQRDQDSALDREGQGGRRERKELRSNLLRCPRIILVRITLMIHRAPAQLVKLATKAAATAAQQEQAKTTSTPRAHTNARSNSKQ
mmetsp:Transcript_2288/g.3016  ORF Transcript_2288/g.3016 Transcript_2288/m.3016 type:complete len:92 (-) Transcript_2288:61-336(-)